MGDDANNKKSRIRTIDKVATRSVDESRLRPVAKISKFFHKPLLSANSHYIAYPTSRPGIVRVIDQDDGNHIALNTAQFGAGTAIGSLELKEVSSTETVLVVCSPGVIVWKFQHGTPLEDQCAGVNITERLGDKVASICLTKIWPSKSSKESPKLIFGNTDSGILLTECDGKEIASTTVDSLPSRFGLGDYPNVAIFTEKTSLYHWTGYTEAESVVRSPIQAVSLSLINNSQALITGKNEILIISIDSPAYEPYGMKIPDISVQKAFFLAPYLVGVDTSTGDLLVVKLATSSSDGQSIQFERIVRLVTDLSIYDIAVTKSLSCSATEIIDVHILHSGGLHILSIRRDDLNELSPEKRTTRMTTVSRTPSPSVKAISPNIKSSVSSLSVKDVSLSNAPSVSQTNGFPAGSSPLTPSIPRAPSQQMKKARQVKDTTKDLLESYSRDNFKEKTYTVSELLTSGKFVSKSDYDQMQEKLLQHILRLEQKTGHLDKKLEHVTTQLSLLSKRDRATSSSKRESEKEKRVTDTSEEKRVHDTAREERKPSMHAKTEGTPAKANGMRTERPRKLTRSEAKESLPGNEKTKLTREANEQVAETQNGSPSQEPTAPSPIAPALEEKASPKPFEIVTATSPVTETKSISPSPFESRPKTLDADSSAHEFSFNNSPNTLLSNGAAKTFVERVYDMAGLVLEKQVNNLDRKAKDMMKQFDYKQVQKSLEDSTDTVYRKNIILLSAISCLSSLTAIDEDTNQWIHNLLQDLDFSDHDDETFINSVIKRAKQSYIEHGGSMSNILIKFNYYEKITSVK